MSSLLATCAGGLRGGSQDRGQLGCFAKKAAEIGVEQLATLNDVQPVASLPDTEGRSRYFVNLIKVELSDSSGKREVGGSIRGRRGMRLVSLDGYQFDAALEGTLPTSATKTGRARSPRRRRGWQPTPSTSPTSRWAATAPAARRSRSSTSMTRCLRRRSTTCAPATASSGRGWSRWGRRGRGGAASPALAGALHDGSYAVDADAHLGAPGPPRKGLDLDGLAARDRRLEPAKPRALEPGVFCSQEAHALDLRVAAHIRSRHPRRWQASRGPTGRCQLSRRQ
jgi:hypothetical protein